MWRGLAMELFNVTRRLRIDGAPPSLPVNIELRRGLLRNRVRAWAGDNYGHRYTLERRSAWSWGNRDQDLWDDMVREFRST